MPDGFNTSPFILPNMFQPPGQSLENTLRRDERERERKYEIDFRNQRLKEADDWKKLQLIQELTNLDKYQTGEATADAIGNQKAAETLQKYTSMASSLTPAQLQGMLSQDMQKVMGGMKGLKDELAQSDKDINTLKQLYPSIDTARLRGGHRAEILNRRIKGDTEFANPLDIPPSTINLSDPDFLSDFIDVNKGLKEAVVNPKNMEKNVPVLTGSPSSYTKFTGNLPYYMKENFDREKDFKSGFFSGKSEPTMGLKTTVIPQGAFSGSDKSIEVLDEGAYEGLISENAEAEMALRKLAKTKYSNYASMTNDEKEIARRDVAKDFISPYAKNFQFRAETATKPPHYSVNMGASKRNDTQDFVQRYKSAVESKDPQAVVDVARGLFAGNGRFGFTNLKVNNDDMGAVLEYTDEDGNEQKETLKLDDPNIFVKLAGLYQKITGSDAKLERNIFEGKKDYSSKDKQPTGKYSFNGASGTYQQLIDAFGSKEKVDAAIKDGRIKKQ